MVELVQTRVATLADVAEFIRGVTFKPNDVQDGPTETNVDCLRTKNVQASLDTRDVWAIDPSLVKRPNQYVTEGDILISSANSWNLVGKCSWIPRLVRPTTFGGFVTVLRRRDDSVDSRYLFHWFSSARVQRTVRSFGNQTTNISNLDLKRSASLPLPLPPLDEQRRIAFILDKADELRTKRHHALAVLDALKRSVFDSLFSPSVSRAEWTSTELGNVAKFFGGSSLPEGREYSGQEGGFALLKVSDMNRVGNEVRLLSSTLWNERGGSKAATCPENTIIIPKRGAAISTNKKRITTRPSVLDPNLMGIAPSPALNIEYLYAWFNAFDLGSITSGSSVPQLNKQDLAPLVIEVPPISLQETFAKSMRSVDRLRHHYRDQVAEMEVLFSSLQNRAFNGEL